MELGGCGGRRCRGGCGLLVVLDDFVIPVGSLVLVLVLVGLGHGPGGAEHQLVHL
jgi:hypothetical protein